jgi:thiamine-phosphate pyrophosphorylase
MVLAAPRLIVITDLEVLPHAALVARVELLSEAAAPGTLAVLLRDHARSARERLVLGQELRRVTTRAGQWLWLADRLDLALFLGADGAHLGEHSVDARSARRLLGRACTLSRAWHRTDAVPELELEEVDSLLLSPVLAERKGRPALGVSAIGELVSRLAARSPAPRIYALGGVTPEAVAGCLGAGAFGVAAIAAALSGDAPALLRALGCERS